MKSDQKKILWISLSILFLLSVALFIPVIAGRIMAAIILVPFAVVTVLCIKKRSIYSHYRKQITMLIAVMGVLFVVLYYMTGLRFGFYKSPYAFSPLVFFDFFLPTVAIIISIEMIRAVLLAQSGRAVSLLAYLIGVLADVLLVTKIEGIETFNKFMDFIGLALLPALVANYVYGYLSKRYGARPNIVYRLLITLYPYLIPILPKMPDSLYSFAKLIVPVVILAFFRLLYEKKEKRVSKISVIWARIFACAFAVVIISIVMLISCQFHYGLFVIKTESMTGELNVGDAVIYESYEDQEIRVGEVIVFRRGETVTIHRVIEIKQVNGEARYYTKGDANDSPDLGYVVESEIVGIPTVKLPYVGYPTLWVRELFS